MKRLVIANINLSYGNGNIIFITNCPLIVYLINTVESSHR